MPEHHLRVLVPAGASKQVVEALVSLAQRKEPDKAIRLHDKASGDLLDVRAPSNRYFGDS